MFRLFWGCFVLFAGKKQNTQLIWILLNLFESYIVKLFGFLVPQMILFALAFCCSFGKIGTKWHKKTPISWCAQKSQEISSSKPSLGKILSWDPCLLVSGSTRRPPPAKKKKTKKYPSLVTWKIWGNVPKLPVVSVRRFAIWPILWWSTFPVSFSLPLLLPFTSTKNPWKLLKTQGFPWTKGFKLLESSPFAHFFSTTSVSNQMDWRVASVIHKAAQPTSMMCVAIKKRQRKRALFDGKEKNRYVFGQFGRKPWWYSLWMFLDVFLYVCCFWSFFMSFSGPFGCMSGLFPGEGVKGFVMCLTHNYMVRHRVKKRPPI